MRTSIKPSGLKQHFHICSQCSCCSEGNKDCSLIPGSAACSARSEPLVMLLLLDAINASADRKVRRDIGSLQRFFCQSLVYNT
nr:hypothetical protein [Escherichia coli]